MAKAAGIGHNKPPAVAQTESAQRLTSIVQRIERLEEERKELASDIKDIYLEAKSAGYAPKVVRLLIRERKRKTADVQEEQGLLDVYRHALGMI